MLLTKFTKLITPKDSLFFKKVNVTVNPFLEQKVEQIRRRTKLGEEYLRQLDTHMSTLNVEMEAVNKRLFEIEGLFARLYNISKENNDDPNVTEMFKIFTNSVEGYSNSLETVRTNFKKFIKKPLNDFRKEKKIFIEFSNKIDAKKDEFLRQESKLMLRKEELFKSKNISKWQLEAKIEGNEKELLSDKIKAFEIMLPKVVM